MAKPHDEWTVLPNDGLVELTDGILTATGEIPMPAGNFPRRMTVIRLTGDRTAIYSAISLAEPDMARIEALGRPAFLIVPSATHRMDAATWKKRYPEICVVAPHGALAVVADVVQVDDTRGSFGDPSVTFEIVAGTEQRECALRVRRADGVTLICNDIIGNVRHPHGVGAQVMARLFGFGVNGPRVPRLVAAKVVEAPAALARQLREWASIPDLRRLVPSHGEIVDHPADALLAVADHLSSPPAHDTPRGARLRE
jgi:hypothetical protein